MEKVWLLLSYVVSFFEWMFFYHIVLHEKVTKPTRKGLILLLIVLGLRMGGILILEKTYFFLDIVWIVFSCTCYSMSLKQSLKTWFVLWVVISVLESCVNCIMKAYELCIADSVSVRIIKCASIVIIILWLYHFLLGRKLNREILYLPRPIWRLFVSVLYVVMLMMAYFVVVLDDVPTIRMVKFGSVIILAGGLAICGMIVAVIYYFNGTEKYKMQSIISEKYNEQQKEYFTKLLEKEYDTKKFRHDIINHLIVMQEIAKIEKCEKLQKYVADLLEDINSEKYKQYDVGNDVVNTILNYYLLPVKDVCAITVCGYMPEKIAVSQKDLCTLFSNTIKNAVESATNAKKGEIEIIVNQGEQFLNIYIKNTMNGELVLNEYGLPLTSKGDKDNHGLGLVNVKHVVEKYAGSYSLTTENNCFITEIYLKI